MRALERDRQKKDNHNISELHYNNKHNISGSKDKTPCNTTPLWWVFYNWSQEKVSAQHNADTICQEISWSYDEEGIQRTRVKLMK